MTGPTQISRFHIADLRRILQIENDSFGPGAWPADQFRAYAAATGTLFLVARTGGTIAGYSIARTSGARSELVSIAVAPRFRRQHIAQRLMRFTMRQLAMAGVSTFRLTVRRDNIGAVGMYRSFGFVRTRTIPGYYEDGATGWRMVVRLR